MSDLGLHCLPMSHKKDFRLIWVNANADVCTRVRVKKIISILVFVNTLCIKAAKARVIMCICADSSDPSLLDNEICLKISSAGTDADMKGTLAIRRIFSLVDMITKPKFSNCPNVFKIGLLR